MRPARAALGPALCGALPCSAVLLCATLLRPPAPACSPAPHTHQPPRTAGGVQQAAGQLFAVELAEQVLVCLGVKGVEGDEWWVGGWVGTEVVRVNSEADETSSQTLTKQSPARGYAAPPAHPRAPLMYASILTTLSNTASRSSSPSFSLPPCAQAGGEQHAGGRGVGGGGSVGWAAQGSGRCGRRALRQAGQGAIPAGCSSPSPGQHTAPNPPHTN